MRKRNESGVFRITGARSSLQEDVRGRQRRYVISMGIRTIAVILTVVLWDVSRPVAIAALVIGLVLPYVAVVIANAGRENATPLPSTHVPMPTRPMIATGPAATAPTSPADARAGRAKQSAGDSADSMAEPGEPDEAAPTPGGRPASGARGRD